MSEKTSSNPLKAILSVRKEEAPLAILMFFYFFLVISTFWVLKPIKKSLFFDFYDHNTFEFLGASLRASQAELLAKVLNMFVAYGAVVVFSALSKRWQRERLAYAFCGFFGLSFAGYALSLGNGSAWTAWSFYLFGDLYNTIMVTTFFAFLNDSIAPSAARRVYGPILLGGVTGGAFGSMVVRGFVKEVPSEQWMLVCVGLTAAIAAIAAGAGKIVRQSAPATGPEIAHSAPLAAGSETPAESGDARGGNPAVEGAKLVFSSRYLLAIVGMVGLYEIISTIMDFQFSATVEHYAKDGAERGVMFSTTYLISNLVALFVQLFLTSAIMTRFRLTVALLILPIAALTSSTLFLVLPLAFFGRLLNTADNGLNYSINQSAREALYTVTSRDEKYKAKAFIDMFVQRAAKAVAVGVTLLITLIFTDFSGVRYLTLFTLLVGAFWAYSALYAGRHFQKVTEAAR